jgi:hypothetical protein
VSSINLTASSQPRQQPVEVRLEFEAPIEALIEAPNEPQPRRRGRPVGSKNKPKTATTSTRAKNKPKAASTTTQSGRVAKSTAKKVEMQLGKMSKAQMTAWMLENGWGQQDEEDADEQEE